MIVDSPERRKSNLHIVLVGVFAMLLFIIGKLFAMQLFSGGVYRRASEQNGIRIIPISAPRGLIKDRNKTVLVKIGRHIQFI